MKTATIHGPTVTFDLEAVTDAIADLNAQRHRHGCRCRPRAAITVLPGGWFVANTTHDSGCPAVVGSGR